MPHCGFDDIEGADVTFLDIVLLAKSPPAMHEKKAAVVAWDTTHLPRPSHCGLERDHGRLMKPNCITEIYWQSLQLLHSYWFQNTVSQLSTKFIGNKY
jgi:hypothetical protein